MKNTSFTMKMPISICALALIGFAIAVPTPDDNDRGCRYVNGRCYEQCEVGTHSYTTGCGYLTPEATCEEPNPVQDTRGHICDYSACYCDAPTVRNKQTDKCVPLQECPKKE